MCHLVVQFHTESHPPGFARDVGRTGKFQNEDTPRRRTVERFEIASRIASYELAFRMQTAAPEAVDVAKESEATAKLYGLDNPATEKFGRKCMIARRLVERGVRFVEVYSGGGHSDDTWDAHGNVDKNHELHARETDLPMAGLLTDLKSRGLLDETLVVWAGEFGRTSTSQNTNGRDHSPRGFGEVEEWRGRADRDERRPRADIADLPCGRNSLPIAAISCNISRQQ